MAEGLGKLAGAGGAAEQLLVWEVLGAVITAALQPPLTLLTREVNKLLPSEPLTAAQLADMVVRNIVAQAAATEYAKESGVAPADFLRMVQSAGEAPSPEQLVQALRRGVIPHDGTGPTQTSFEQGIAESRLYNKWRPVLEALADVPLPVADAVDAVVEGQIGFDEGAHAAYLGGISRDTFQVLVNTRGNPPSPTELLDLHRRGLIPLEGTGPDALTVQQGIFEGATKDKWWRLLAQLGDYVVPPRTVTALVREGSITDEVALQEFQKSGLDQAMATAYLHSAHHQKLAATKELAKADVEALYRDQAVSAKDATAMLVAIGYTAEEAAFILQVQDVRRQVAAVNTAISRVHNLYVARKLERSQAVTALDALKVPSEQRDQLLATWDIERGANVKVLSAGEIASAFYYKVIDQDTATAELVGIGYTPVDAWILLSVRVHGPLANPPAGVTVPSGG